jgi:tRNA threonylcarbamoyladenosine biosynthesis protein TsaE
VNKNEYKIFREIISNSEEETENSGKELGEILERGQCIGLEGDLGSGKTVFVRGLAQGLKVDDSRLVDSPTYKIINTYEGKFILHHLDLYRLDSFDDILNIGLFDVINNSDITVIEWAEKISEMRIDYSYYVDLISLSETSRRIVIYKK